MTQTKRQTLGDMRRERGLTQMALAAAIGAHVRLVQRWEMGEGEPSLRYAVSLAEVLKVSLDVLAGSFTKEV